ncbi:MAG: GatB/YqeY domain-containing protein [bacterium]
MAEAQTFIQMKEDMKTAMKAKAAERLSAIRMLIAALKNKQIDLRRDLTEEEIIDVLSTEAKKRRDSIEQYTAGNRPELAAKEEAELEVIAEYLPKPLTEEEVIALVEAQIAKSGAANKKDMGKVMGPVVAQTKGRFDGGRIKDLVLSRLAD